MSAGLSFAVIDFETAHPPRHSVCQVGTTIVREGEVEATYEQVIIPPTGLSPFSSTHVHGLTPEYVAKHGRPWRDVEPLVRGVIGDLPVVAHSVIFDKSVYMRSCEAVDLIPAEWEWFCTRKLSEEHLGIGRLVDACGHLQIDVSNHHQAGADTLSAARLALRIADRIGADSITTLWHAVIELERAKNEAKRRTSTGISQAEFLKHNAAKATRRYRTNADFPPPNSEAPENPLKGAVVLITGELPGWNDRDAAYDAVAAVGGRGTTTLSGKTTVMLAGDGAGPKKLDKAAALGITVYTGTAATALLRLSDDYTGGREYR